MIFCIQESLLHIHYQAIHILMCSEQGILFLIIYTLCFARLRENKGGGTEMNQFYVFHSYVLVVFHIVLFCKEKF